jgi:hypothetical protein
MTLESQVCSLEFAKRLRELGVKQESLYYWIKNKFTEEEYSWSIFAHKACQGEDCYVLEEWKQKPYCYSAFTVAELGMILPVQVASHRYINDIMPDDPIDEWTCLYTPPPTRAQIVKLGDTEADCRAKMLIHLKEQGIV